MCYRKNMLTSNSSSLKCHVLEHVTLLPMVYVDANPVTNFALGAHVAGQSVALAHRFVGGKRSSQALPPLPAQALSSQEVIYGGMFFSQWGHFITETLQRLWYTKLCHLPIVWAGKGMFYADGIFFMPQHEALFAKLGIKNTHIFLDKPTQFAKVHFPEPGFELEHYAHAEYKHFLACHEGQVQKGKFVYVSRAHFGECVNERALEEMLRQRGWQIVYPEKLSLDAQLDVLTTAQVCLMMAGSAQHSLLFTQQSQTRFIVIPRIHSTTYELIATLSCEQYYLLQAPRKRVSQGTGAFKDVFSLDLPVIEQLLLQTEDFTCPLDSFSPLLQKHDPVDSARLCVPDLYRQADISVTAVQTAYYTAIFAYNEGRYADAFAHIWPWHERDALEFFMYDYFYMIVEKYDALMGTKTALTRDKLQFQLQKISREIENNPQVGENYIRMAEALQGMQRFGPAKQVLQKAIQQFPGWAMPHAALAQNYAAEGHIRMAAHCARKAFDMSPHDAKIKEVFAYCLHLQTKNTT